MEASERLERIKESLPWLGYYICQFEMGQQQVILEHLEETAKDLLCDIVCLQSERREE